MRRTITKIRGLTVNIEVVEVTQTDVRGGTIWYHAAIYIQVHGNSEKRLVRRSRLPGAAAEFNKEIQRDGIRAFDRIGAQPYQSPASHERKGKFS
jgi:hypothetical protein